MDAKELRARLEKIEKLHKQLGMFQSLVQEAVSNLNQEYTEIRNEFPEPRFGLDTQYYRSEDEYSVCGHAYPSTFKKFVVDPAVKIL